MRTLLGTVVRRAALGVQSRAREAMAEPKHGRVYRRGRGRVHRASAPGEAPAIDTGALANSIQVDVVGETEAVVYTNQKYAAPAEFGTARMAPRPFMKPAADAERGDFERAARAVLKKLG